MSERLRQQQIAYNKFTDHQNKLADAYDQSYAAAKGASQAYLEASRQQAEYEAMLRSMYPTEIVVRQYDPIYDGMGIYVPGRHPR